MKVSPKYLVALLLFCFSVFCATASTLGRKCKDPRYNRYGDIVCLDDIKRIKKQAHYTCPFMPRMEVDCDDRSYFKKEMKHKKCTKDSDCPKGMKCCTDICPGFDLECLPGDFMSYFVPFK